MRQGQDTDIDIEGMDGWTQQQPRERSDRQVSDGCCVCVCEIWQSRQHGSPHTGKNTVTKRRAPSCPGVLGESNRRNGDIFNVSPCAELPSPYRRNKKQQRSSCPLPRIACRSHSNRRTCIVRSSTRPRSRSLPTPTHNLLTHLRDYRFQKSVTAAIQLHGTPLAIFYLALSRQLASPPLPPPTAYPPHHSFAAEPHPHPQLKINIHSSTHRLDVTRLFPVLQITLPTPISHHVAPQRPETSNNTPFLSHIIIIIIIITLSSPTTCCCTDKICPHQHPRRQRRPRYSPGLSSIPPLIPHRAPTQVNISLPDNNARLVLVQRRDLRHYLHLHPTLTPAVEGVLVVPEMVPRLMRTLVPAQGYPAVAQPTSLVNSPTWLRERAEGAAPTTRERELELRKKERA